ncbi:MAG: alpha/beta fold hydrolase [Tepidiformaceae bacterium]
MATTTSGGCKIWYDTMGEGPPVVMVYGIGGNSRGWWDDFPALLARRYRLVMLDNRGTGNSEKPETAWTMPDMTADVLAVADAAGLESFHLLGCSLGSMIVRHLVRQHGGDRIRSLSLLCPPNGIAATDADRNAALFWDRTKPLIESARAGWPIIHPGPWIAANDARLVAKFEASQLEPTPPRTFVFQFQAATDAGDANSALNDHDWPVLIAHGTLDRLVPPGNAHTLKQQVPRARLEMLEGDSHNFWAHDPERAAAIVLDFLDAAERRHVGK